MSLEITLTTDKMNVKVIQYFPDYMTGFTPIESECNSLESLFNLDWISKMKKVEGFSKFTITPKDSEGNTMLMIHYINGEYYVAANILGELN